MQVPFRGPAALASPRPRPLGGCPRRSRRLRPPARTRTSTRTAARWEEVSRKIWELRRDRPEGDEVGRAPRGHPREGGLHRDAGSRGDADGVRRERGLGLAGRRDPRRVRRPPRPLAEGGRGEEERRSSPAPPGHGCGHNLLGTAAVAAAVAANRERVAGEAPRHDPGLRHARRGADPRQDVHAPGRAPSPGTDVVLSWHPEQANYVYSGRRLAITAVDVEFFGKTAHAAANPWLGRSSLDALEVFEHAMSLMREHVLPTARLHRVDQGRRPRGEHHSRTTRASSGSCATRTASA